MSDSAKLPNPWVKHHYGSQVHLLNDSYLLTLLGKVCSPESQPPLLQSMLDMIYTGLLQTVMHNEFPTRTVEWPTRMQTVHPEGVYKGKALDPDLSVVCVNLARAGSQPSQVCYQILNHALKPENIRQDHVSIARTTNMDEKVTGSQVHGHKVGGDIENKILLFPDPMGATGSTIIEALKLYQNRGKPLACIALHCIVTPEYLRRIRDLAPELSVYSVRLDRGLSKPAILDTVPGTHWDQEKGLNPKQYIVPGGGGFGELLNNAYV